MLLRSSSTPILKSWMPQCSYSRESSSSPEQEFHVLQRSRSVSLSNSTDHNVPPKTNLHKDLPKQQRKKKKNIRPLMTPVPPSQAPHSQEKEDPSLRIQRLYSSSALGEKRLVDAAGDRKRCGVEADGVLQTMVMGGGVGSNGGKICGGGGGGDGGGDGGGGSGFFESNNNNHGSNSTETYYQKMIEANPSNALLLGNYARFLKEVKGDYAKAEEYCGRAILASPGDGTILSLYADLIWQTQKDAQRAENYFGQAVKTAPDDCYVMASYARFLWDVEEEEDDDDKEKEKGGGEYEKDQQYHVSLPSCFHGASHHPT